MTALVLCFHQYTHTVTQQQLELPMKSPRPPSKLCSSTQAPDIRHVKLSYKPFDGTISLVGRTWWLYVPKDTYKKWFIVQEKIICTWYRKLSDLHNSHLEAYLDTFESDPPVPQAPNSRTWHVTVYSINTKSHKEFRNMLTTGLPGQCPITSVKGHKYPLFVMFCTDSNFIKATSELLQGLKTCNDYLKWWRFCAKLLWFDNAVGKELI